MITSISTRRRSSESAPEFARNMATDFPTQGMLDHLVHRIVGILPIDAAGVTLISATTDPELIAASDESAMRFERLQSELGEGPCLATYATNTPISIPDLTQEARFSVLRAARSMVSNLLSNAVKFTEDGEWVHTSLRLDEANAHLEVSDNGIGIPEDEQVNLFVDLPLERAAAPVIIRSSA